MRTADELLQCVELLLLPPRNCLRSFHLFLLSQDLLLLSRCQRLRSLELVLLLLNLGLLFFEGVDEDGGELIVFDAFDLAFRVAEGQQRLDLLDFFSAEADVFHAVLFPLEQDRAQTIDDVESTEKCLDVALVTQA